MANRIFDQENANLFTNRGSHKNQIPQISSSKTKAFQTPNIKSESSKGSLRSSRKALTNVKNVVVHSNRKETKPLKSQLKFDDDVSRDKNVKLESDVLIHNDAPIECKDFTHNIPIEIENANPFDCEIEYMIPTVDDDFAYFNEPITVGIYEISEEMTLSMECDDEMFGQLKDVQFESEDIF